MCAIWWHDIPTNSGDSYGHKLCSTYSRLIFILLREGFYVKPPKVQTVWPHRQVQRYLDDIFTIDYPEFAEHIPDIYPRELQLNKATKEQRTKKHISWVYIWKLLAVVFIQAFTINAMTSGFLWLISPGSVVVFLSSHHKEFIFRSWFDLLDVVLALVFDFHSKGKDLQITSGILAQGCGCRRLRVAFRKFFRSYSELLSKFGAISFEEYVSQGITHPVFYGDLVYKLRRVKGEANFILSGSKIVKCIRRRQYDPDII